MAAESFVGYTDVHHVTNTEGERHFAAIGESVSGIEADAIHEALVAAKLSEPSGLTRPMPDTRLEIGDAALIITPVHTPFGERAEDPEGVVHLIDEQHQAGKAVAMLYKTNGDPADESYHWASLTGHYQGTSNGESAEKGAFHVIDPSHDESSQLGRNAVLGQIKRSMDFMDVYVCTIEPAPASPAS